MAEELANADLLAYWMKLDPDDVMMELRSDVLGFINVVRRCAELLAQEANVRGQSAELGPLPSAVLNDVMIAFLDKSNELQDEMDVVAAYVAMRRAREAASAASPTNGLHASPQG